MSKPSQPGNVVTFPMGKKANRSAPPPPPLPPKPSYDEMLEGVDNLPPIDRNMARLKFYVRMVIEEHAKLLYVTGPPGIGKTETISEALRVYTQEEYARWSRLPPAAQARDRRAHYNPTTERFEFHPPWVQVSGSITNPAMFRQMYRASSDGSIFFLDDVEAIGNRDNRLLIQQATDPVNLYQVQYNKQVVIHGIPTVGGYPQFTMHGNLIVNNNQRGDADSFMKGIASQQALFSRAYQLIFPWEQEIVWDYINRKAFAELGLLGYMRREPSTEIRTNGLGFKGSDSEAVGIIQEVQTFYNQMGSDLAKYRMHDFRMARRMLQLRLLSPQNWRSQIR